MSTLSKGRRVHFLFDGKCYVGDVVQVWNNDLINIVITLDGGNDSALGGSDTVLHTRRTSVRRDDTKEFQGSWHWPEREGD